MSLRGAEDFAEQDPATTAKCTCAAPPEWPLPSLPPLRSGNERTGPLAALPLHAQWGGGCLRPACGVPRSGGGGGAKVKPRRAISCNPQQQAVSLRGAEDFAQQNLTTKQSPASPPPHRECSRSEAKISQARQGRAVRGGGERSPVTLNNRPCHCEELRILRSKIRRRSNLLHCRRWT